MPEWLTAMKAREQKKRTSKVKAAAADKSLAAEKSAARDKPVPSTNRLSRTRLRTRQKLIEAARIVMGKKGVDAATIAEITGQADVGFGSFYDHFKSKTEIANVLFELQAEELARQVDEIFARVPDEALAVSFVHRWILEKGRGDPVWGWFIIHADLALEQVERTLRAGAQRDIQRAVDAGSISVNGVDTLVTITLSSLFAVMRRQLEGKARPASSNELVEALLRMNGWPHDKAHAMAYQPLPDWLVSTKAPR
jgi:AcrR family transcriptional regulator